MEGFKGFEKRLPEDCVEYIITSMQGRLRDIQTAADALTKRWLKEYIWQRESFKLTSHGNTLQGRTNFGDSIADEWLIVYLLRELSKQFPDAWIRLTDSDGEFLLIEAAKVLPKWLGPEVGNAHFIITFDSLCHEYTFNCLRAGLTADDPVSLKCGLISFAGR